MPENTDSSTPTVDLCLSGGGFRATLFHLGVVRLLFDLGLFPSIRNIYGVSAGGILAAHLALYWPEYSDSGESFTRRASELIRFTQWDLRARILRQLHRSPTKRLQYYYARHLFPGDGSTDAAKLSQLKGDGRPGVWLVTTNLTTGALSSFTPNGFCPDMSKPRNLVHCEDQPIAMAVAASSAFSLFFPPVRLTPKSLEVPEDKFLGPSEILLTDGGIHDNLGIRARNANIAHTEDDSPSPVIVSDASLGFDWQRADRASRVVRILRTAWRAFDIASRRLYELDSTSQLSSRPKTTHIPIATEVPQGRGTVLSVEVQRKLQYIRTDLDRFTDIEVKALVQHGYETARHVVGSSKTLTGYVSNTANQALWDPLASSRRARDSGRESKELYRGQHRRLGLLSRLTVAVATGLLLGLAGVAYWWNLPERPDSLTGHRWAVGAGGRQPFRNYPWLRRYADILGAEGVAAEENYIRVSVWETEPLSTRTRELQLQIPVGSDVEMRALSFQVRTLQGTQWLRELSVNADGSPTISVPPSKEGDVIALVTLEMASEPLPEVGSGPVELMTEEEQ